MDFEYLTPLLIKAAVSLMQFFFVRASVFLRAFVLPLFVPNVFFLCLREAVLHNCGLSWVSPLVSLNVEMNVDDPITKTHLFKYTENFTTKK